MKSRLTLPPFGRPRPAYRAIPWSTWTTEVAHLEIAEVGEKRGAAARLALRRDAFPRRRSRAPEYTVTLCSGNSNPSRKPATAIVGVELVLGQELREPGRASRRAQHAEDLRRRPPRRPSSAPAKSATRPAKRSRAASSTRPRGRPRRRAPRVELAEGEHRRAGCGDRRRLPERTARTAPAARGLRWPRATRGARSRRARAPLPHAPARPRRARDPRGVVEDRRRLRRRQRGRAPRSPEDALRIAARRASRGTRRRRRHPRGPPRKPAFEVGREAGDGGVGRGFSAAGPISARARAPVER